MASEQDLYETLGVEAGASTEAIKAAYRRLVREHHPDGKVLTPEEKTSADSRMVELNLAWTVLSDPIRRREYDERRSIEQSLRRTPAASSANPSRPAERAPATFSPPPATAGEAARSLQLSKQLREKILADRATLHWEKDTLEGFDWALTAKSFLTRYSVALRREEVMDGSRAKRFVALAGVALRNAQRRAKHHLLLMLVDRLSNVEEVRSICREFCASPAGKGCSIVMIDTARARGMLCSAAPSDDKMLVLLGSVGVSGF